MHMMGLFNIIYFKPHKLNIAYLTSISSEQIASRLASNSTPFLHLGAHERSKVMSTYFTVHVSRHAHAQRRGLGDRGWG